MITVHTRDELKRAAAGTAEIIAVSDPRLCYELITLVSRPIRIRRLLYSLEMRGYQMKAKKLLGQVEVKFVKGPQ